MKNDLDFEVVDTESLSVPESVEESQSDEVEPAIRHSTRERHPPGYLRVESTRLIFQFEPTTVEEATNCRNSTE